MGFPATPYLWASTAHSLSCGPSRATHIWRKGHHQIAKNSRCDDGAAGEVYQCGKRPWPPQHHPRSQGDGQRHPECRLVGEYSVGDCRLIFWFIFAWWLNCENLIRLHAEIYGIQVGKWWNHLSLLSAPAADSHNCFKDDIILGDSLQPTTDMKWLKYRVSIRPATFSVTRKHLNFRDNPIYKISPNGQKAILRMNSSYSIHRFVFNPEKVQTTVSNLGFNVFRLELYTK